jgi:membrane protein YdbS with pleckstrin-like domain
MQKLQRLRPRLSRLWLPTLVLALCAAVHGFFIGKQLEPDFSATLYIALGLAMFFFWLLPTLAYLGTFVDLFEDQLVARKGIFGVKRAVPFVDIESISGSVSKGVVINVKVEKPLVLKGYPKPKAIAADLIALAK